MLPSQVGSTATTRRRAVALPDSQGETAGTGPIRASRTLAHGVDGAARESAAPSTLQLAVPAPATTPRLARSSTGAVTRFTALAGNDGARAYAQPAATELNRGGVSNALSAVRSALNNSLNANLKFRHTLTLLAEETTYIITLSWRPVQIAVLCVLAFFVLAFSFALLASPVARIFGVQITRADIAACAFLGTVAALKFRLLRLHVYPAARSPLLPY